MSRVSVVLTATVLVALSVADAAPFEGMIRGTCLHVSLVGHSVTSISSVGQRGCGGPSLTALLVRRGQRMLGSSVSLTSWFSEFAHGEDPRATGNYYTLPCQAFVSERKTQSPLIWLKYQKTELPKPGAAWFNTPFKDFARCVNLIGVVSLMFRECSP